MKAMIAAAILTVACQAWASSFTNFATTNSGSEEVQDIIVKFKGDADIQSLGYSRSLMSQSPVIKDMNIQLIQLAPGSRMDVNALLEEIKNHPDVEYAQLDHKITYRDADTQEEDSFLTQEEIENGPNDPKFAQQWGWGLSANNFGIDAISAWVNYGTGGKTADNNDIVVALVDGGIEITHNDLKDNIWANGGEIAGNGVDDDQNGYVDDINGWNAVSNNGSNSPSFHGTHVAGTVGAKGNNEKDVTGVNWDVKIMDVRGSSGNTTIVLRAYNYILKQKKLWIETNGKKGANVVSTNSSFGIDRANCESGDYPAWNDIYTEMGKVGILSAAATANRGYNVDQVGDVPTGCSSPYLISVTNNETTGARNRNAAYGIKAIDLAAPGTNIHSTGSNNSTRNATGTSMATPHVAGAVAFLRSVASKPLNDLYNEDPAAAALEMKKIILGTVTKTRQFETETVSGGILNLNKAAEMASKFGLGQE